MTCYGVQMWYKKFVIGWRNWNDVPIWNMSQLIDWTTYGTATIMQENQFILSDVGNMLHVLIDSGGGLATCCLFSALINWSN